MAKKKFYVVWQGREPGVYTSWDDCKKQIDGFSAAKYKSFPSMEEAEQAFKQSAETFIQRKPGGAKAKKTSSGTGTPVWKSISVDAACSGNPGVMEYQGVVTTTKQQLFIQKYPLGTNNIGEFLAIVHGLAYLKKINSKLPMYTDSRTALAWVKKKKCGSKLERNAKTESLFQLVDRAEAWLKSNTWETEILKWDTKGWGEIPADFGRK
jgi:ribonuclease HI